MGKTRKCTEEIRKLRGQRLKNVMKRYNLKYKDLYPIAPNESSVSAWLGGYEKGYLSETKAIELINTFFPSVRLGYLLGTEVYMTENEKLSQEWDKANDDLSNSMYFHEIVLMRMFEKAGFKFDYAEIGYSLTSANGEKLFFEHDLYDSICDNIDNFIEFLAIKTIKELKK